MCVKITKTVSYLELQWNFFIQNGSELHIFVLVYKRFERNQTDLSQQKRGER